MVAWPRDRLLTVYQPDHIGDTNFVVHRGEITKMSRECQILADRVVVKYGFAGRVLLGPKGGAGPVSFGVSVRVAGAQQNTLATDKMKVVDHDPARGPGRLFLDRPGNRLSRSRSGQGPRTTRSSSPSTGTLPGPAKTLP